MAKILFLMRDFRCGGGEKMTLSLLSRLDRSQFQPLVVVLSEKGPLRTQIPKGIRVLCLFGEQGNALQFLIRVVKYSQRLRKIVEKEKPHILITDNWFAGILGCCAVGFIKKNGVKLIVEFHLPVDAMNKSSVNNLFAPAKRFITSYLFRKADRVVAISKQMAADIILRLKIEQERIALIYNGIDINDLENLALADSCKYKAPYIVVVGRLEFEKGHQILLRAFKAVSEEIPNTLVLVGDGSLRRDLELLANELLIQERVIFTGVLLNPYAVLQKAQFLVLPSKWEAFPFALLEALALHVPVIATDCDGPREILNYGEYGMLVLPENVEAMAAAIKTCATNAEIRNHFNQRGKARAAEYSLDRMVAEYEKLFSMLLGDISY